MTVLRLLGALVLVCGAAFAELPAFYKKVSRVTWVTRDAGRVAAGWSKLGFSPMQESGEVELAAEYRGKPASAGLSAVTGFIGDLAVDILQPVRGENALTDFLARHGDGIFSVVHEVPGEDELNREIDRMKNLGVPVLQRLSAEGGDGRISLVYFDTEPRGKYVLGLVHWPGGAPSGSSERKISQIAFVVRDAPAVSAYWEKLGFPAMTKSRAEARADLRYRGKPARFAFDMYWQRHTQFAYEWIVPPPEPSFYAEFLKEHGEGIHHFGVPTDDIDKSIAEYEKLGHKVAQSGAWGETGKKGSGRYAYMDTGAIGGVSAELLWSVK